MAKGVYQRVRGMHDILPGETRAWQEVEAAFRLVAELYGYGEVRVPALEATELFRRSIGDETDIVGKEMYSFVDGGGDDLTLRPEGTAGVVRAYVEHGVGARESVTKWYYAGPMFRRERPQKGRYRQFHQVGAEVLGAGPPVVDAELVVMLADFLGRVGLERAVVLYNNLGSGETRKRYRERLVAYYSGVTGLCEDCERRRETNPLRLLDCKQPGCIGIKAGAPAMRDSLDGDDLEMMGRFRALVEAAGIEAREEARLVRGLDYYTGIVFEVEAGGVVVAGGGRYDDLVERLGGDATPATGFALGLERLIELLPGGEGRPLDLFVLVPGAGAEARAMELMHEARKAGLVTDFDPRAGSVKSQMKRAGKMGARFVAILGASEMERGLVALRDMGAGEQREVALGEVVGVVAGRAG